MVISTVSHSQSSRSQTATSRS